MNDQEEDDRLAPVTRKRTKPYVLEYMVVKPVGLELPENNPSGLLTIDQLCFKIGYYDTWRTWGRYRTRDAAETALATLLDKRRRAVYNHTEERRMRIRVGHEILVEQSVAGWSNGNSGVS